jgi:hypothetical protein
MTTNGKPEGRMKVMEWGYGTLFRGFRAFLLKGNAFIPVAQLGNAVRS